MQPLEADEPTTVGPYRLLGRLGHGGMGRVYLGRSAGGRTVAVKVVHPHFALDEEFRARFRREVEAARRVGGAWTAPVLDADPTARVPWVATGYVAGPSLAQAAGAGTALPEHSVRVLGAGLAEALAAVHGLGLVHRDVKPSNVLLTVDGPRLIDFGIARATDGTASLTSTGVSIGSPGYMAPEQILGKGVTGAADVFSLGAVLAYAATGESPFPGDSSAALLYKVVHEEPELDGLSGELRDIVAACLAKEASARPAPEEVARRLAPEGASRLVAAGWLPGALVEQVSRSAVQLLDLEGATPATGPVGFSSPAVTGGGAPGVFGPPDPSYASAVPQPRTEPTTEDARPGRLSLSVMAASTPATENGRGRKVSCSVALAVAGAFAVVALGGAIVVNMLPDSGSDDRSGHAAGARPTVSASASDSGAGAVPTFYVGSWQGQGTVESLGQPLPGGTFDIVIHQASPGEAVGTVTQTDALGGVCVDVLTLKSVTDKELTAVGRGKKGNEGQCIQSPHPVHLRPDGKALRFTSDDPKAGSPKARLSRTD
ncbi:protein kinase domain-containing protein [Streptomyces sp. cg35]|uniref:serine/threonine-protein kinase n=1 Tax=Streptomyces sp. cg35 TaxID=3421650 RepID=UPI003D165C2F